MRWYVGNVYKEEKMNGNIEYKRLIKKSGKQMGFRLLHALNFDSELSEHKQLTPGTFKVRTY